ncbi:MAG: multiheme c-type cytochrome [Armatimonadota bacterium]
MIVDSGNLSSTSEKLDVITTVMSQMHYDAIGVGANDLRLGEQFFQKAAANKLTVLDASPKARESTKPYMVKVVDGVKVGIISFGVAPEMEDGYLLRKSLYSAYKTVRGESDILIVLDQSQTIDSDWIERNGPRFGAPDIVIAGMARMGLVKPEMVGHTYLCPTSFQGKNLGVVDIEFAKGQDTKIDVRKIQLGTNVKEDEAVLKLVRGNREPSVKASGQVVTPQITQAPVISGSPLPGADRKPYYPPQLCKTCHIKQYEDWAKTSHAKAIKTLVDAKRTEPECLSCHTEMYRRLGQWASTVEGIGGVECATCHVDSLPHGLERRNMNQRVKVSPAVCLNCHTKEHSPDYNEQKYFPMTMHGASQATHVTASVN